jgi:NADH-quinone oxidoreductase subunit L
MLEQKLSFVHKILVNKYFADKFNEVVFAGGSLGIGKFLWKFGDEKIIDGLIVNGSARTVGYVSSVIRHVQTGYLYHYAFAMIIGLIILMGLFVF